MRETHACALLIAILGSGCVRSAQMRGEGWWAVETAHVRLRTDAGRERGRELALALERRHAALSEVFFACAADAADRGVEVDVLTRRSDYEEIAPRGSDGVYRPGLEGLVSISSRIVVPEDAQRGEDASILTHELVHQYVAACFPDAPPWLHEGLAMTYETLEVREDEIVLGRAPFQFGNYPTIIALSQRVARLLGVPLGAVPAARELIAMDAAAFYASMDAGGSSTAATGRYAGGWALVHRLSFGPEPRLRQRFAGYLESLLDGHDAESVAREAAFGAISLDEILQAEIDAPTVSVLHIPYSPPAIPEPEIRVLPPGEAHLLLATLAIQSDNERSLGSIETQISAAEQHDVSRARARLLRAAITEDDAEAARLVASAAIVAPDDLDVMRAQLVVALSGAPRDQLREVARAMVARGDLRPTDRLILAEALRRDRRASSALRYALDGAREAPGSSYARIVIARILVNLGRYDVARRSARVAANLAGDREPSRVAEATELLAEIDARERATATSPVVSGALTAERAGYLTPDQIMAVVRANEAEIRECYEHERASTPDLAGRVQVDWQIDRTGAVVRVEIIHSTLGSPAVEHCIADRIHGWTFPQPDGGEVTVHFPFIFGDR